MALKSVVSNLVSDLAGQHSHDHHAFGQVASSFTAFFPDVAPHHDQFLPSIAPETVHQGDAVHLDQFNEQPLEATVGDRRTRVWSMALKSVVSNLVSDLAGQHSHDHHAFGQVASSFTAFFPDVAPHHDQFLPSIAPETVHQGDAVHLDQFNEQPLEATVGDRRTRVWSMALKSVVSNLVSDLAGQHSHDHHAFGQVASSFTAFFPDVAPHHDQFLPSIAPETVHQGDAVHLDQFNESLMATRRPKMPVSFHKEEEEKKDG
eukprot:symbB.v1.2.024885.t1/scaffold2388.1/size114014/2